MKKLILILALIAHQTAFATSLGLNCEVLERNGDRYVRNDVNLRDVDQKTFTPFKWRYRSHSHCFHFTEKSDDVTGKLFVEVRHANNGYIGCDGDVETWDLYEIQSGRNNIYFGQDSIVTISDRLSIKCRSFYPRNHFNRL